LIGLVRRLRRWLAGGDETAAAGEFQVGTAESPTDNDTTRKTTIDDAEATSLRAIKLPEKERDALNADERDTRNADEREP